MPKAAWRDSVAGLATIDSPELDDMAVVIESGIFTAYKYNGASWDLVPSMIEQRTDDPATPVTNQYWVRTDTDELCVKTATGTLRFMALSHVAD